MTNIKIYSQYDLYKQAQWWGVEVICERRKAFENNLSNSFESHRE